MTFDPAHGEARDVIRDLVARLAVADQENALLRARLEVAEADSAALRQYILSADEVRELLDRTLDAAPGFPLSQCSPEELEKWQDAMHTVLMNLGLWRVATDAYPAVAALLTGKDAP